ncbi:MAG: hypothetical protein HYY25_15755 [Candidatus Wallbacteria bacterium]|nr:hypothetical protein [Candidatus Wallbacteria bacterium]
MKRGLSLVEVLLAAGLLIAALVPIVRLALQERSGSAALDRELAATVAASAVLEHLKTMRHDAVPVTAGEVPEEAWGAGSLKSLAGRFPPAGPGCRRSLRVDELEPWSGARQHVKRVIVRVTWDAETGRGRPGEVRLATVLAPAVEIDASEVLEP